MPNYKTHDRVTLYSIILLAPACYLVADQPVPTLWGYPLFTTPGVTTLLFIGAYLFSGLWLSNDLDINSRIYRRWGPLRFLWYPYQRLVAHRSWISHGLVVGPVVRLLYLYGMIHLVLIGIGSGMPWLGSSTELVEVGQQMLHRIWPYMASHSHLSIPVLVGLVLGGVTHSLLDWV